MLKKSAAPRVRRRRADAERSAAAVLEAAVDVLGRDPEASIDQVAAAAGVVRQTVYAHFRSRPTLMAAVVDRITAEATAALDAVELETGTATDALFRWLDVTWRLLDRYPLLLDPVVTAAAPAESERQHAPVVARLERLIRRGQQAGEFDGDASPRWLVAATIALGHAAGAEVAAGRMTPAAAAADLRQSLRRLYERPT